MSKPTSRDLAIMAGRDIGKTTLTSRHFDLDEMLKGGIPEGEMSVFIGKPSGGSTIRNAFRARLAYERRCAWRYDRPGRPSLPIQKGDRMEDFAIKFGTTVQEMKDVLREVEKFMEDE